MQSTFEALADHLTCDDCKRTLRARTKEVIVQWVKVKVGRILFGYSGEGLFIFLSITENYLIGEPSARSGQEHSENDHKTA